MYYPACENALETSRCEVVARCGVCCIAKRLRVANIRLKSAWLLLLLLLLLWFETGVMEQHVILVADDLGGRGGVEIAAGGRRCGEGSRAMMMSMIAQIGIDDLTGDCCSDQIAVVARIARSRLQEVVLYQRLFVAAAAALFMLSFSFIVICEKCEISLFVLFTLLTQP